MVARAHRSRRRRRRRLRLAPGGPRVAARAAWLHACISPLSHWSRAAFRRRARLRRCPWSRLLLSRSPLAHPLSRCPCFNPSGSRHLSGLLSAACSSMGTSLFISAPRALEPSRTSRRSRVRLCKSCGDGRGWRRWWGLWPRWVAPSIGDWCATTPSTSGWCSVRCAVWYAVRRYMRQTHCAMPLLYGAYRRGAAAGTLVDSIGACGSTYGLGWCGRRQQSRYRRMRAACWRGGWLGVDTARQSRDPLHTGVRAAHVDAAPPSPWP